jgi:hypothetical protein
MVRMGRGSAYSERSIETSSLPRREGGTSTAVISIGMTVSGADKSIATRAANSMSKPRPANALVMSGASSPSRRRRRSESCSMVPQPMDASRANTCEARSMRHTKWCPRPLSTWSGSMP